MQALEDWAFDMVPQPVSGILLLFPIKDASEAYRDEERTRIESGGQTLSENVYFMKQTIGNACGTIGILHCMANARTDFAASGADPVIAPDSYLHRLFNATHAMSAADRGSYLEQVQ